MNKISPIRAAVTAALGTLLLVVSACSTSESTFTTTATGAAPSTFSMDSAGATTQDAGSSPSSHLTGFGATLANWNANHQANPDPSLAPNCCYGPQIDTEDQTGADTYSLVISADDVISMFVHNFPPDTNRADALTAIEEDDLPADAVQISSAMGDGCELFLYTSDSLATAEPDLGSHISFDLNSGGDRTSYDPEQIEGADLSVADDLGSC